MKFLKNKNGIVLETAVIFMVLIFTFCLMLSTMTLIGYNSLGSDDIKLDNDRNLDLIVEDYLAYIEMVELKLADVVPAVTEPATTTAETTHGPQSEGSEVLPLDMSAHEDIVYPLHLLSPLSGTQESTDTEPQAETTQPQSEESAIFDFNYFCANYNKASYDGLECKFEEKDSDSNNENFQGKLFTLKVFDQSGTCILDMQVMKYVSRNESGITKDTVIQYVKKYPQNNSQPEGN